MTTGIETMGRATIDEQQTERKWTHVCVDLETLSTVPGAVVLEIGAVAFARKKGTKEYVMGPEFSVEVSMRAPDQQERDIDDDTLIWWADRMKDGAMLPGQHGGMGLRNALEWLCEWARKHVSEDALWWAWGTDFDLSILWDGLRQFDLDEPWRYHNGRCARTACKMMGVQREGDVRHIAVEDARQEAAAVIRALQMCDVLREANGTDFPEGGAA